MAELESQHILLQTAEQVLTERFGGPVRIGGEVALESSERSQVLRVRVQERPEEIPGSLILKRVRADAEQPYDPDDPTPYRPAWRFFNDWAGAEFLSQATGQRPVCPRFVAGSREEGFILLEDLGEGDSLADLLLGTDAGRAKEGLLDLASALGRMHAATIGREEEYRRVREGLGAVRQDAPSEPPYREFLDGCAAAGVSLSPEAEAGAAAVVAAMREPGPFRAYTHGDPCPDNTRLLAGGLRLLDFEFGGFRHALRDGVYGRIHFPTCWCVSRLPPELPMRMEEVYRVELVEGCPEAADDTLFRRAVVEACAHWALNTVEWHLKAALRKEGEWGIATIRQRLLVRLDLFARLAEEAGYLEPLGAVCNKLADRLRALWPASADQMPLYPAFR